MGPLDRIIAKTTIRGVHAITNSDYIRGLLVNWSALIHQTAIRPTHVKELVEHTPSYRGLVDASKWVVGGVWLSGPANIEPLVWFKEGPQPIRDQLCSSSNLTGTVTILDLELTGILMHFLALEAHLQQYGANL